MRFLRRIQGLATAVALASCQKTPSADAVVDSSAAVSAPSVPASTAGSALPAAGLAFVDTIGQWCVSFASDSLTPGQGVTLIFPDTAGRLTQRARLRERRGSPCGAAFPQQSLAELHAYDLAIIGPDPEQGNSVGIAVLSEATWRRGADGSVRGDINGDGQPEEAKVCAVGEGQLFSLLSGDRKVWEGYFDWGVLVDETCPPVERG